MLYLSSHSVALYMALATTMGNYSIMTIMNLTIDERIIISLLKVIAFCQQMKWAIQLENLYNSFPHIIV